MEMETAGTQSRRWVVILVAGAILCGRLLATSAAIHLAIVAVSTVMAVSIALAAVIALTGRNLW